MAEARRRADAAGFYRFPLPAALGGRDGSNVAMAAIREHLAWLGPGLHAELSHEASVVANLPLALVPHEFGTAEQRQEYLGPLVETTAHGDGWVIDGAKRFNSVVDVATADLVFARTSGQDGKTDGITAFLVPTGTSTATTAATG